MSLFFPAHQYRRHSAISISVIALPSKNFWIVVYCSGLEGKALYCCIDTVIIITEASVAM
jgi:hypothetical protein